MFARTVQCLCRNVEDVRRFRSSGGPVKGSTVPSKDNVFGGKRMVLCATDKSVKNYDNNLKCRERKERRLRVRSVGRAAGRRRTHTHALHGHRRAASRSGRENVHSVRSVVSVFTCVSSSVISVSFFFFFHSPHFLIPFVRCTTHTYIIHVFVYTFLFS